MAIQLRSMTEDDIEPCGRICFEAFKGISDKHNFRWDFPTQQQAVQFMQSIYMSPHVFNIVAEQGGEVVGSNHLCEYDDVRAVGPITVDPSIQAQGVGRRLMEAVLDRGAGSRSIRLVQDAFNSASLSLYTSLGFAVKEPLVMIEGVAKHEVPAGTEVRVIQEGDFEACAELCRATIGFDRTQELRDIPSFLSTYVAVRDGKIRAYAAAPHFWAMNHAAAETVQDMAAVLAGASGDGNGAPLSFLLPVRQAELFRWCLSQGLRVLKPMNLMAMGEYKETTQPYLPSVGY
jgi:predicted N-acetyltransferase YhbS